MSSDYEMVGMCFRCKHCNQMFYYSDDIRAHIPVCEKKPPPLCCYCGINHVSSPGNLCAPCVDARVTSPCLKPTNAEPSQPLFESSASATLERVKSTFCQRGSEYGDTWKNCQFLNMKAVAQKFGITIPDKFYRALCVAGFSDMKYQRLEGGYKDDTIVDRIAYDSLLAEEVRRLEREA